MCCMGEKALGKDIYPRVWLGGKFYKKQHNYRKQNHFKYLEDQSHRALSDSSVLTRVNVSCIVEACFVPWWSFACSVPQKACDMERLCEVTITCVRSSQRWTREKGFKEKLVTMHLQQALLILEHSHHRRTNKQNCPLSLLLLYISTVLFLLLMRTNMLFFAIIYTVRSTPTSRTLSQSQKSILFNWLGIFFFAVHSWLPFYYVVDTSATNCTCARYSLLLVRRTSGLAMSQVKRSTSRSLVLCWISYPFMSHERTQA